MVIVSKSLTLERCFVSEVSSPLSSASFMAKLTMPRLFFLAAGVAKAVKSLGVLGEGQVKWPMCTAVEGP
eukprot:995342-Ditylum_brightwellii.AAC.1